MSIDQSQFEATQFDHVFYDGKTEKYYFRDETGEANGKFDTEFSAKTGLDQYLISLNAPKGIVGHALIGLAHGKNIGINLDILAAEGKQYTAMEKQELENQMFDYWTESAARVAEANHVTIEYVTIQAGKFLLATELDQMPVEQIQKRILDNDLINPETVDEVHHYVRTKFLSHFFREGRDEDDNIVFVTKFKDTIGKAKDLIDNLWKVYPFATEENEPEDCLINGNDGAGTTISKKQVSMRIDVLLAWTYTQVLRDVQRGSSPHKKLLRFGKELRHHSQKERRGHIGGLGGLLNMLRGQEDLDLLEMSKEVMQTIAHDCVQHEHDTLDKCNWNWSQSGERKYKDMVFAVIDALNTED